MLPHPILNSTGTCLFTTQTPLGKLLALGPWQEVKEGNVPGWHSRPVGDSCLLICDLEIRPLISQTLLSNLEPPGELLCGSGIAIYLSGPQFPHM